jgi:nicotinamide mononucleotide transporter
MKISAELLLEQFIATSIWEWLAVVLAIAYLFLAIKESLWCWPAAFFSTLILSIFFFDANLYMESLLNIYYLAMAIYGFYQWKKKPADTNLKPIVQWPLYIHGVIITTICLVIWVSGFLLKKYTEQDFAYLDSFTTWFAVVTTFMVTKKVLENWLYWIVIDSVTVYLYLQKGFVLLALLMLIYTVIAIFGYSKWQRNYYLQNHVINE